MGSCFSKPDPKPRNNENQPTQQTNGGVHDGSQTKKPQTQEQACDLKILLLGSGDSGKSK